VIEETIVAFIRSVPIAVAFYAVVIVIAVILGRDAQGHGRNGWAWGAMFVFNPIIFGIAYLFVRNKVPREASLSANGSWHSPSGATRSCRSARGCAKPCGAS
jgi:hypothetical protein